MRARILSDLRLGLSDMLEKRDGPLKQTAAGKLYKPRLIKVLEAISALPPAVTEGRPLAEALAVTDGVHDGYGSALWHYTEAILRAPGVDPESRAAAERIRAAFIPELVQLRASYATEAAAAVDRRPKLAERKEDLRRFPLPGKRTLASWAEGFITHGEQLLALLTERANVSALADDGGRSAAGALRGQAIGLLQRLRVALADEFADDPAKLREVDKALFSFVDQLAEDREAALRRQTGSLEAEPPVEPTPAIETVTTPTPTPTDGGATPSV
jgi:hypothetical protein